MSGEGRACLVCGTERCRCRACDKVRLNRGGHGPMLTPPPHTCHLAPETAPPSGPQQQDKPREQEQDMTVEPHSRAVPIPSSTYQPEGDVVTQPESEQQYPAAEPGVFDLGMRHFVLPHGEAGYLWWHDCPAVEHVSWGWFGRVDAERASGHRVVHHVPSLTVEGSLVCTDCRDHGFIRDNRWVPA